MSEDDAKTYKFGTICYEKSLGQFIVWYNTRDKAEAMIMHSCITNVEKSFLSLED